MEIKTNLQTGSQKAGIAEMITTYREDVAALVAFLPWLEKKSGEDLSGSYVPEQATAGTMHVPVYDATLLAFIKAAGKTKFMNRNYVYTYSRKRIRNAQDEIERIRSAQILDLPMLGDILSYYVLKGQIKSRLWNEGMENGVFCLTVRKMKELIEYWTKPM